MIVGARFLGSASSVANAPEPALSELAFLGRSNVGKSSLINALTKQKIAKSSNTPGKTQLINFFEVEFKVNLNENLKFNGENSGLNSTSCLNLSENSTLLNLNSNSQKISSQNLNKNLNLESENSAFQKISNKNSNSLNLNSKNSNSNLNLKENSTKNSNFQRFSLIFIDLPGFGYARVSRSKRQEWDKNLDEFLRTRTSLKLFIHLRDARHEDLELDEQINAYLQGILSPTQSLLVVFTKADKLNQAQKARLNKAYPNALLVSSAKKTGLERLENALIAHTLGLETTPIKSTLGLETPTKRTLGL